MLKSFKKIDALKFVVKKTVMIRIENQIIDLVSIIFLPINGSAIYKLFVIKL